MSMNYEEALEYIHHVSWTGVKPGLSRTFELLDRMGNPQKQLKFVHIAGTNGKGSTAAMTASILEKSGYRTGLYTSPFIHRFNERMQVNGESITDEELAELTEWIRPMAETMEDSPTEFELITALAMEFFRRQVCDIVVLEVGMGGELDSTNVIDTPELGDTLGKIASAKGGIIKACGDVVIYPQAEEAEIVLKQMAEEKYCHVFQPDFSAITPVSETLSGQTFDYGKYHGLKIPMAGAEHPGRTGGHPLERALRSTFREACCHCGRFPQSARHPGNSGEFAQIFPRRRNHFHHRRLR